MKNVSLQYTFKEKKTKIQLKLSLLCVRLIYFMCLGALCGN